ncbi:MAG: aminoglycoside phosphotransferase family protein [Candidatus Thorarchaeota archaeon]|jgi:aminoglycoside phosphotransferase (APT) family kinase protein
MTKRQITTVHGLSIPGLEKLLQESCEIFDDTVHLEREAIGGWSNINIRGSSSSFDFVVKLPLAINPVPSHYDYLHTTSDFFGKLGITGSPLCNGTLSDDNELPYIILEYLDGVTHNRLDALSHEEIGQLNVCLKELHKQNPPSLRSHYSPLDYLLTFHGLVENHQGLPTCSEELRLLIQSFTEFHESLLEYAEILGSWSMTVMHGDLWIPNVVLKSEKAFLLDFESCAFGESQYDLAYLLESPEDIIDPPPTLLEGYDENRIDELRPIALGYIIEWSLERLLSMESNLIEPNLDTIESVNVVMDYTRSKIKRLKAML